MNVVFETNRLLIKELSPEEMEKFNERRIGDYENNEYTIHLKSTDEQIGIVGYLCREENNAELRYGISSKYQNNGYMTETIKGLIDYLFKNGKEKIVIICNVDNIPSNKVAVKAGCKLIKTFEYKQFGMCNYYQLIKNEYYNY